MKTKHISVLLQPTIHALNPQPGGTYIDATVGGGGHLLELAARLKGKGTILALDQDKQALDRVKDRLLSEGYQQDGAAYSRSNLRIILAKSNFENLNQVVSVNKLTNILGIMADLGLSSDQLDDEKRGFSFLTDSDLDMRMDSELGVTAKDLVNALYANELERLLVMYGDLGFAKRVARAIVEARKQKPIQTTQELRSIVQKTVPFSSRKGNNRNPEAKVFQALRIAVNNELQALENFLRQAFEILGHKGRLAVISFHSGEDRIVKHFFKDMVQQEKAKEIIELLIPDSEEVNQNPRSASAKMRAIVKL